jgi:hypothetical protein
VDVVGATVAGTAGIVGDTTAGVTVVARALAAVSATDGAVAVALDVAAAPGSGAAAVEMEEPLLPTVSVPQATTVEQKNTNGMKARYNTVCTASGESIEGDELPTTKAAAVPLSGPGMPLNLVVRASFL